MCNDRDGNLLTEKTIGILVEFQLNFIDILRQSFTNFFTRVIHMGLAGP